MMTAPRTPSTMTTSPPFTSPVSAPSPTTAGIPIARAMMAVWPVGPPPSMAMPCTVSGSTEAVWLGLKSWATRTTSVRRDESSSRWSPSRLRNNRRSRSSRSGTRETRKGSCWNTLRHWRMVRETANSAVNFSLRMRSRNSRRKYSSRSAAAWALNISAMVEPAFCETWRASRSNSSRASSMAASSRCSSPSMRPSVMKCSEMRTPSASSRKAWPMAMPGLTGIPLRVSMDQVAFRPRSAILSST